MGCTTPFSLTASKICHTKSRNMSRLFASRLQANDFKFFSKDTVPLLESLTFIEEIDTYVDREICLLLSLDGKVKTDANFVSFGEKSAMYSNDQHTQRNELPALWWTLGVPVCAFLKPSKNIKHRKCKNIANLKHQHLKTKPGWFQAHSKLYFDLNLFQVLYKPGQTRTPG